ncbi:uncharacterized protein LOC132868902 [Neoarius graeffei]|uniref:uncharacterized protein LOC132868902 n=1 Tax=Neoarius graeffei TaxID=443677 RepID=UPI00298D16F8|nr:uncharacterized protein LOC132868902 [Neoarius graeffei]
MELNTEANEGSSPVQSSKALCCSRKGWAQGVVIHSTGVESVEGVGGHLEAIWRSNLFDMGEKVITISAVVPSILSLSHHLEKLKPQVCFLSSLVRSLQASLNRRFLGIFINMKMARTQDGVIAPFSDPIYLKAAALDPASSLLWVEPHVLVNRDVKAEVAQQVKELILQDAAETEQPVPFVDEEEQEDLREGEGLFAAYHKRQKKDVGTTPSLQLSHYLDIAEGQNALLFWALNLKTLPSLF